MGGSKGYKLNKLIGRGKGYSIKGSVTNKNDFLGAVASNVSQNIVSAGLGLIISQVFPLNTLVAGLELVKLAIQMTTAAANKYEETGDENQAIEAAAGVVIDRAKEKLISEVIRVAVGAAVDQTNIKMNDSSKEIMVDTLSSVVEGVVT